MHFLTLFAVILGLFAFVAATYFLISLPFWFASRYELPEWMDHPLIVVPTTLVWAAFVFALLLSIFQKVVLA